MRLIYNLHILMSNTLQYTIQQFLLIFTELCIHYHNLILGHSHHSRRNLYLYLLVVILHFLPPRSQATTKLNFQLWIYIFWALRTNGIMCGLCDPLSLSMFPGLICGKICISTLFILLSNDTPMYWLVFFFFFFKPQLHFSDIRLAAFRYIHCILVSVLECRICI